MKIKIILMPLFLLCVSVFAYFVFKPKNVLQDVDTLIIGTAAGYAPWVSINIQGEYEGFDIDIAHILSKQMCKKLIIKDLGSMTSLFAALEQGKIDAIIWGMSITHDRLKKVAMINYQGQLVKSYPLLFWKTIPTEITSIVDMKGKTICVEPTSHQEDVLCKYYNSINRLSTDKVDDALLTIQYGRADAAFVEPAIAKKFKSKFQEIQTLEVPLDPADQVAGVGIVVKKDNKEMILQISQAIEELKTTGIITQLEQKWNLVS